MSRCRSCKAPITWALTANGSWMPVDEKPHADGNVTLTHREGQPSRVTVLGGESRVTAAGLGRELHRPHFSTCPRGSLHRKAAQNAS